MTTTNNSVYFKDIEQAMFWYMEQKRKQYLTKTSDIYDSRTEQNQREMTLTDLLKWTGIIKKPEGKEEIAMVMKVFNDVMQNMNEKTKVIAMLTYLGDFATPAMYEKARKNQKILKEKGYRVVIRYKYPQTVVAEMLNVDRRTIYRHLTAIKESLYPQLLERGFIVK